MRYLLGETAIYTKHLLAVIFKRYGNIIVIITFKYIFIMYYANGIVILTLEKFEKKWFFLQCKKMGEG